MQMHLLPRELAQRWRSSIATLANLRCAGDGPRYVKFGRKVLYPLSEIEKYEREHLRQHTHQSPETPSC